MPHQPLITVITPNLNHGRYLERTLCSVLDQGYENMEYLILDGGSDDQSTALIRDYNEQITFWRSRPDGGPAHAINQGLARASGEIVCIVPADDLLLPGALHTAAARMSADDSPDWAIGGTCRIDAEDRALGQMAAALPDHPLKALRTRAGARPPLPAMFFRRFTLDLLGRFEANLRFAFGEELCARCLAAGVTPALIPQTVAAHREHSRHRTAPYFLPCARERRRIRARYARATGPIQPHAPAAAQRSAPVAPAA